MTAVKFYTRVEIAAQLGYTKSQLEEIFKKIRVKPKAYGLGRYGRGGLYFLPEVTCEIEKLKSKPKAKSAGKYVCQVAILHEQGHEGETIPTIARQLCCCPSRLRRLVHASMQPVATYGTTSIYDVGKVEALYRDNTNPRTRQAKRSPAVYDRSTLATKAELMELLGIEKNSLNNYITRANVPPVRRLYEADARTTIYNIEEVKRAIGERELSTLEAKRKAAAHMRALRKAKVTCAQTAKAKEAEKRKALHSFSLLPLDTKVAQLRAKGLKTIAIAKELAEPVDKVCQLVEAYDKAREAENMENK